MLNLRSLFLACLLAPLALWPEAVQAEDAVEAPTTGIKRLSEGESFWELPDQESALFEKKMAEADRLAMLAGHHLTSPGRRQGIAERALRTYEEAIAAKPSSAEAHFRAGYVSTQYQTRSNFPAPLELERAIEHFVEFERLAPQDSRLSDVLIWRSLLRTKRGGKRNIELGVTDYEEALTHLDQASAGLRYEMGRLLSNRAELLMMLGRLEEAIKGYEAAIEYHDGINYGYGLAVALDRDGQGFRAREVVRHYAIRDPKNALHDDGTFFVPAGEIYYYKALRAEGLADYRQAQTDYRKFLQRLPTSPFAARARVNLAAIAKKAASQPAPKKSRKVYNFRRPF